MTSELSLPHSIGRYTLTRRLGRGGMGVVYAARDERLDRPVAVKMIAGLSDEAAVKRFWREARTAASVSHPNVCQIYEVDEAPEGIFLAMELLQGEPLDARLARGSCRLAEAVKIAIEMLAALAALHERGIVHRDVKPSNVFLTAHGVKLLDFGLARPITEETVRLDGPTSSEQITRPGMVVGTPRYMAPEQVQGGVTDGRTDLYAVGTVLFEMLAGRPPFLGDNFFDLAHAAIHEHPPALQGSPAVVGVDRVIRRALGKAPAARYATAQAMSAELRSVPLDEGSTEARATVRTLLRLVVPPLRLQREDADTAFLSYGLAEAVSGSLAGLSDVVVRSPAVAARWSSSDSDPRKLAAEADVDVIISGSLARAGEQLRASVQLVEATSGTVKGATSVRGMLNDIFAFEDQLAQAVVGLLAPLRATSAPQAVRRDVPANARAFEFFLRGLELARSITQVGDARIEFQRALDEDPAFAPAWAWLGRCHRVMGKFVEDFDKNDRLAEEAFRRALALSPELPIAHRFFTHFESEHGASDAAIARLLQHSKSNRNDAQLFAALVHACRYGGLLGASLAAHEEARRLDPTVPTSVEYTLLAAGNVERLKATALSPDTMGALTYALLFSERYDELSALLAKVGLDNLPPGYRGMVEALTSAERDRAATVAAVRSAMETGPKHDPEAVFLAGMVAARLGDSATAFELMGSGVRAGFSAVRALEFSPALSALRDQPQFASILDVARQRRLIALAVFERGEGPTLLGVQSSEA